MSIWTHVDGFLTVDAPSYGVQPKEVVKKIKKLLGATGDKYWKGEERVGTLPNGSEGPMSYQILVDKHKEKDYKYKKKRGKDEYIREEYEKEITDYVTIIFYGNLRDFGENDKYWSSSDNPRYIEHWFRDLVDDLREEHCYVRAGVLQYECEDADNSWLLQVRNGAQYGTHEVIRVKAPKEKALERIW